ncbi:MAG TPA: M48 family metallopeptidase [Acidobacteriota bacterium]|jgi:hypothetical protein
MNGIERSRVHKPLTWLIAIWLSIIPVTALAQTHITPPSNKYSPSQDVELGRQAAVEAEKQLPLLRDEETTYYVERIGRRLADSIPAEYRHPEFRYTFKVVDASDINAFALPGGPMYVNRGMIQAAHSEGEVAGVMAHEMSHVALRHGTAQATKAEKYQIGAIAGAILGAVIGGNAGSIISQGSQFGLGAAFLRFSREYEKQADILGAQIMARAGYDPMDLVNMFKTIERQGGGSGGPQWLSDHPNPGNREAYIAQEARYLQVTNPIRDTRDFASVQSRLRGMPPARSTEQIMRGGQGNPRGGQYPSSGQVGGRVEHPSSRYRTYREGNLFEVSVPENWRELAGNDSVTFAPDGAYGQTGGQSVFTHGVQIGVTRNEIHDLRQATDEFIQSLMQGNSRLRQQSGYQRGNVGGREGLAVSLNNVSEVNGRPEIVAVYTTLMSDGNLFYVIAVAPRDEFGSYQGAFQRVTRSIQIYDSGEIPDYGRSRRRG